MLQTPLQLQSILSRGEEENPSSPVLEGVEDAFQNPVTPMQLRHHQQQHPIEDQPQRNLQQQQQQQQQHQQQQQQQQQQGKQGSPSRSSQMLRNQPTAPNQREQQQQQLEEDGPPPRSARIMQNQPTALYQREQQQQQLEEVDPPGHPNNPIGSKRAKKIVALERQVAETRAQMAKVIEFQSKTLQESISAATVCATSLIFRRFQNIRRDLVQTVS